MFATVNKIVINLTSESMFFQVPGNVNITDVFFIKIYLNICIMCLY